jgi:hypothetical protein
MEVYGCKVNAQGVRQVELLGGWVGFDNMTAGRQQAVLNAMFPKMSNEEVTKWVAREKLHLSFQDSAEWEVPESDHHDAEAEAGSQQSDDSDGNNGDGTKGDDPSDGSEDSKGEGEDDESEGESDQDEQVPPPPQGKSDSDSDDEPVMHSEFDPWANQVGKAVEAAKKASRDAVAVVETAIKTIGAIDEKVNLYGDNVDLLLQASANVQKKLDLMNKKLAEVSNGNGGGGGGAVIVQIDVKRPNEVEFSQEGVFHTKFPTLTKLVAGGHHVYLPGPPGSGKSHAAEAVSQALGWGFGAISLGPTTPESRLWGGMDANGQFHCPPLAEGLIFAEENPDKGFVFCLDELDNGHPGIIATLNSSMANGWVQLPNGRRVQFGDNMVFVGCANTYGTGPTAEFSGRNRLDAATLDRFRYLPWDTDKGMEGAMVRGILANVDNGAELAADWLDTWNSARKNVEAHGLKVFVTMRGALAGAKMLAQGFDLFDTYEMVLANKLPEDQAKKISPF